MPRPLVDAALDTALTTVKIIKKADSNSSSVAREVASELTDVIRKKEGSELRHLRDNVSILSNFVTRRPLVSLALSGVLIVGFMTLKTRRRMRGNE